MPPASIDPEPVLFGGLSGAGSVQEAEEWINKHLMTAGLPPIINPFIKSEAIENILFAKFQNKATADTVVELFRTKAPTFKDSVVWCGIDRPPHVRIPLKAMFRTKKMLAGWGFQKRSIRINEETCTMTVADKPVMQVTVRDGTVELEWLCDEWREWTELQQAAEFVEILSKCREDVAEARQRYKKGVGKGKTHA